MHVTTISNARTIPKMSYHRTVCICIE